MTTLGRLRLIKIYDLSVNSRTAIEEVLDSIGLNSARGIESRNNVSKI